MIVVNGYSTSYNSLNQSKRLKEEFEKLGVQIDIINNDFFIAYIGNEGDIHTRIPNYDFCIYLDKDKYISQMLERKGMRLFNCHQAIQDCDDKMLTFIKLSGHGINMPLTLPGLLCYDKHAKVKEHIFDMIETTLGYPLIIKNSYGSLGKGVYKVNNQMELREMSEQLRCVPHLFQKFISTSIGRDIRIIVIGEKVVASMLRYSEKDFRSNIELGGIGEKINLPASLAQECVKISRLLNLDYCGIDMLIGEKTYYLCEVNSNAFFGAIEKVSGVNIAKEYAQYVISKISENSARDMGR